MQIEILGMGCAKCELLARRVNAIVNELGLDADVRKITDIVEIADRGVLMTPALSIDGEVKLAGTAGSADEIRTLLVEAAQG